MRNRDREKKRAGGSVRPKKVTDAQVLQRIDEACRLMRQQNTLLLEQLRQQRHSIERRHLIPLAIDHWLSWYRCCGANIVAWGLHVVKICCQNRLMVLMGE
jgi:hypothetical protein